MSRISRIKEKNENSIRTPLNIFPFFFSRSTRKIGKCRSKNTIYQWYLPTSCHLPLGSNVPPGRHGDEGFHPCVQTSPATDWHTHQWRPAGGAFQGGDPLKADDSNLSWLVVLMLSLKCLFFVGSVKSHSVSVYGHVTTCWRWSLKWFDSNWSSISWDFNVPTTREGHLVADSLNAFPDMGLSEDWYFQIHWFINVHHMFVAAIKWRKVLIGRHPHIISDSCSHISLYPHDIVSHYTSTKWLNMVNFRPNHFIFPYRTVPLYSNNIGEL